MTGSRRSGRGVRRGSRTLTRSILAVLLACAAGFSAPVGAVAEEPEPSPAVATTAAEPEASEPASPEPSDASATADPSTTPSATPEPSATTEPTATAEPTDPATTTAPPQRFGAAAANPSLAIAVSIESDGTPGFDADDSAGNDSGARNGVVRVNDTVTYRLQYAVTGPAATNTTLTLALPKGLQLAAIPAFCLATGSSLNSYGAATLPLTATSLAQLNAQTLTCNLGEKENASEAIFVGAKVSNLVGNATDLTPTAAGITADAVTPVAATSLPTVTTSARLKWDLTKNGVATTENTGRTWTAEVACPWDTSLMCYRSYYPLLLSAPSSGKGAMPAIGAITVVDDVSPAAMFPGLTAAQRAAVEADPAKYGVRVVAQCGGDTYLRPGDLIGGTASGIARTATNSVRNTGSCVASQAGPGQPATITITGADTTLETYPSEVLTPPGQAIPAGTAYAISTSLLMYTPIALVKDFGVVSGTTWTLQARNTYTSLSVHGLGAGDAQAIGDQPAWNDYRTTTMRVAYSGGLDNFYAGVPGAAGNQTATQFSAGYAVWVGPPGSATRLSGAITVAPTQSVISSMLISGTSASLPANMSVVACDAWDKTRANLQAAAYPGTSSAAFQQIPSGGSAVWISGYNNVPNGTSASSKYATTAAQVPALAVQYSALAGANGAASECGTAQGPWYDDPAAMPGNDPALAAQGVYTAVGRVRVHSVLPPPTASTGADGASVRINVSVGLRVADSGLAAGATIPTWASHKRLYNSTATRDEVLAAAGSWTRSSYTTGADRSSSFSGAPGDRLILAPARARVEKLVRKGTTGTFGSSSVSTTGGDLVQFRLAPTLTSAAAATGILKDLWVEDCLPAALTYSQASPTPSVVQLGSTPADAKRTACAAGQTYLRWVFKAAEVNQVIDPVVVTGQVAPTADDGSYTNTVQVWAEGDSSTVAERSASASFQVANVAGVKLATTALTPVVQVNRTDAATPQPNRWEVRLSNTLPTGTTISDPDVIDVLPVQGADGTAYAGTLRFVSAEVTAGASGTRLLYTSAATVDPDPAAAGNGATGGTAWCDAPAGGALVLGTGSCPAAAADVTAVRMQRPGTYPAGTGIAFEVALVGVGNRAGDAYVNSAVGRAAGLDFPVGPVARAETVVSSAIGDRVWWDLDGDGAQQAAEQPASGVVVSLSGPDDLGNPVALQATTDSVGHYGFDGLRSSGSAGYTVRVEAPAGASGFTARDATGDNADSDVDASGAAVVALGSGITDHSVDAGLRASGGLRISKLLAGVGVRAFAGADRFRFDVTCTLAGATVFTTTAQLDAGGADSVLSDVLGPVPAGAACVVTETGRGAADAAASPATVVVPWDAAAQSAGVVTASLTNYYSLGTISVAKRLVGDATHVAALAGHPFGVQVRCQKDEAGTLADLYSGLLPVAGGQVVAATDAAGEPVRLPAGTRCFATEPDADGAVATTIDHGTPANAVAVETGFPWDTQELRITVTNEFRDSGYTFTKASDPASGTAVAVGDVVGYTLTGTNTGGTALATEVADDLGDVLAGADLVEGSLVAEVDGAAAVAPTIADGRLAWSGRLEPGQQVVIRYAVQVVRAAAAPLRNLATSTATPPHGLEPITATGATTHVVPGWAFAKAADPAIGTAVAAGSTIGYTLTGTNTGSATLTAVVEDDLAGVLGAASIVAGSLAATVGGAPAAAPVLVGTTLAWSGAVPPGQAVVVTYRVLVAADAAGAVLRNTAAAVATPPDGLAPLRATGTTVHRVPGYTFTKTANPASGSVRHPGDLVTYTLTGTNTGATDLDPVVVSDDLSGVLGAASIEPGSLAATVAGEPAAAPTLDGTSLAWTGRLQPGESVVVTYRVRVADDAEGVVLQNSASSSATPQDGLAPIVPPTVQTSHPTPGFSLAKQAVPASGTAVQPGQRVEYTLVAGNFGATALDPVVVADDRSGVLPVADLDPASLRASVSGADVAVPTVDGTGLRWTGPLAAGEVLTLRYAVVVHADASGASAVLTNRATATATAADGRELTAVPVGTTHPVAGLALAKTSDPASGELVWADDVVHYAVTATNTGATRLDPVVVRDDLAGVLHAADLDGQPVATLTRADGSTEVAEVSRNDAVLGWTGVLDVGEAVRIDYAVVVRAVPTATSLHNVASATWTAAGRSAVAVAEVSTSNPVNPTAIDDDTDDGDGDDDGTLAYTGATAPGPLLGTGAGLVLVGALLLLARRRRA